MTHLYGITTIAVVLAGTCGLLADAAIAYGIFRYRRLRTIPNIFLANWAIADMLSIIVLPTNIIMPFMDYRDGGHEYTCLLIHGTMILHFGAILFGILLLIDWCTAAYYHRTSEKLRKYYSFLIGAIWLTVLLSYCLSASLCISHIHYYCTIILFIIMYVINISLVIALQCSRIVQKFRANPVSYPNLLTVRLTVITVISCSYLLPIINTALLYYNVYHSYTYMTSFISVTITIVSVLSSSTITLGVLCWLDKDFRLCLFPKQNDLHERFENEVSDTEDHNKDSSPISYDNPTHCISNSNHNI